MNGLEEQADNAQTRDLYWKSLSWLGTIRPTSANDASDPALWFVSTTLGLEVPVLSSLSRRNNSPLAKCGCKKHALDLYGDHTSTCTAHSGETKAYDWMVGVLGPLFRTAGHAVRTQHSVTASAGQRRGDVEIRSYLQDAAGRRSLVFDLSITHDRLGAVATCSRTVCYRISRTSMRLCVLLRSANLKARGNNTLTIRTFLFSPPLSAQAHACTASFCVFFFYRPTGRPRRTSLPLECHRNATTRTRFVSSARHSTSR
jgi:hypothetical protein